MLNPPMGGCRRILVLLQASNDWHPPLRIPLMTTDEFFQSAKSTITRLPQHQGGVRSAPLVILAILAVLYTIYLGRIILMPFCVAAFIALFLSPLVRGLTRLGVPKLLASATVVLLLLFSIGYTASLLTEPAGRWLSTLPVMGDRLTAELADVTGAFDPIKNRVVPVDETAEETVKKAVDSTLFSVVGSMAQGAIVVLVQLAATVVITFFFLMFGEDLMRNVVKAQDSFSDKKTTVVMFQTVRDDIAYYVLTISVINVLLGFATAGAMTLLGVEDAILWGAMATILNFAPYVGPLILTIILAGVGFMEAESFSQGLVVPGVFLMLNLLEGQFITPSLLGRRFNINPLLVVLWMFLWSWLWGAVGLLIAIPILMCLKIMAKHMEFMGEWSHVLNGVYGDENRDRHH